MKLLLDTHAFLFAIGDPDELSPKTRKALLNSDISRWVSAVSLWEIAFKIQIGKLNLPANPSFYREHLQQLGAAILPIDSNHSFELLRLPLHHKDPFDRLLIAQARVEDMTLVTRDKNVRHYDVRTLW